MSKKHQKKKRKKAIKQKPRLRLKLIHAIVSLYFD